MWATRLAAGIPVISVLDLDPVKVRVAIPEAEIGKVHEGARATVTIPSLDGRQFEGKVEAVGVAADPASRTLYGQNCGSQSRASVAGGDGERSADLRLDDGRRNHRAGRAPLSTMRGA